MIGRASSCAAPVSDLLFSLLSHLLCSKSKEQRVRAAEQSIAEQSREQGKSRAQQQKSRGADNCLATSAAAQTGMPSIWLCLCAVHCRDDSPPSACSDVIREAWRRVQQRGLATSAAARDREAEIAAAGQAEERGESQEAGQREAGGSSRGREQRRERPARRRRSRPRRQSQTRSCLSHMFRGD